MLNLFFYKVFYYRLYLPQRKGSIQETEDMEINNVIIGSRLHEIQKKPDEVRLVFEDTHSRRIYVLTFKGVLFETAELTLNKKVKNIQLKNRPGFRPLSYLHSLDRNPGNYKQLFIQTEGSSDDMRKKLQSLSLQRVA